MMHQAVAGLFLLFLLLLLLAVSDVVAAGSGGCGGTGSSSYPAGTSTSGLLLSGGHNRTFIVYVPSTYRSDSPSPLVLLFHGGGGSSTQAQKVYKMDETAEANNFIVVYPNAWEDLAIPTWNAGACCNPAVARGVDDVGFVSSLLDHLADRLCVDTTAVFSTGMSNGGLLTYRLYCQLAERLAAVAPVAGTLEFGPCTPARPVPLLEIHGSADVNVPYWGGRDCGITDVNFTSVPATIDAVAAANGCRCRWTNDSLSPSADGDVSGCPRNREVQGHGTCVSYGPCATTDGGDEEDGVEADVVLCTIDGGGHTWPGAPLSGAGNSGTGCNNTVILDFDTNAHIWAFFNATRRASSSPTTSPGPTPSSAASVGSWIDTLFRRRP